VSGFSQEEKKLGCNECRFYMSGCRNKLGAKPDECSGMCENFESLYEDDCLVDDVAVMKPKRGRWE
jgi:hypothetical protein